MLYNAVGGSPERSLAVTHLDRILTWMGGATGNAGTKNAKMKNAEPDSKDGKHKIGKQGTKFAGVKTQDLKTIVYGTPNGVICTHLTVGN